MKTEFEHDLDNISYSFVDGVGLQKALITGYDCLSLHVSFLQTASVIVNCMSFNVHENSTFKFYIVLLEIDIVL